MSSVALCVICKNEVDNFPQMLASVRGCFDEIHVTDTGSTDGTLDLLEQYRVSNPADSPLFVHRFEWVNDFAAARNASFSHAKTDYLAWLDLDDVLDNPMAFIEWRQHVMPTWDFWIATYHYGGVKDGKSPCKFMRERVVRNGRGFAWKFFVHEGILGPKGNQQPAQYVTSWSVIHRRTDEDMKKDRSRNLRMFEGRGVLEPRMQYYYGKELFENSQAMDAFPVLVKAAAEPDLEIHDRIMALQYACMSAMQCGQVERAIQIAHQGLQLAPGRAEFHVVIGDGMVKQGKLAEAVPFYSAAKSCVRPEDNSPFAGAIFSHAESYSHYPRVQLARCYFHLNRIDAAKAALEESVKLGPNVETVQLLAELERVSGEIQLRDATTYEKVDEIAITCLPQPVKDWDESSLATRGLGGSETAVIHMARALRNLTGLRVRVFNERQKGTERDGVSYHPVAEMYPYFKKSLPRAVIAWRHNVRTSPAPMYIWCHDLCFVGLENGHGYDHVLALSNFHRQWLTSMYGVPPEKIIVTRNGIDPLRYQQFDEAIPETVPTRVIFSSSPDRGLARAIAVMDEVVKQVPEAELHVYYGFDGMRMMQKHDQVAALEALIAARPYVKFHGNVPQRDLALYFQEAAIWLYPTDFLETFCITAIEALCAGAYPVVRKFGGLQDTLAVAASAGMADVLDCDCSTPEQVGVYAERVIAAIREEKWRRVKADPKAFSWDLVAAEWGEFMRLPLADGKG